MREAFTAASAPCRLRNVKIVGLSGGRGVADVSAARHEGKVARMLRRSGRSVSLTRTGGFAVVVMLLAIVAAACVPSWTTYHREPGRSGSGTSAPDIVPVARA